MCYLSGLVNTLENSCCYFLGTAAGISAGADTLDESRLVMTFFEVMEILCSLIEVLEGKTGGEIPESPRLRFSKDFI